MYVVVSGAPGSGKTTLARPLAAELRLPLLAKDTFKEAIAEALAPADVAESRRIGRAAIAAMLAVAAEVGAAVLDNVWRPDLARGELAALPGPIVEVACCCPPSTAKRRYRARAGSRHAAHFDADRLGDDLWLPAATSPVAGPWPVLEVDTTEPVSITALAASIHASRPGYA